MNFKKFNPENKLIADIGHRMYSNLLFDVEIRNGFCKDWSDLEKRIKEYYNLKGV